MLISRSKRLATVPLFAIVILIYLYHSPTERYVVATTRPQYDVTSKSQSHSPSNAAPSPLIDSNANANTNANINAVPKTNVTHDPAPQHKNTSQVPTAPPRIRQVTMVLDNGGSEQEMYERALETHYAHGERWGYSTHVLQQDIVGSEDGNVSRAGQWKTGVFKKPLYLLSLVVAELAKPEEERADWFDADTIILNPNIPWSVFLPPSSEPIFNNTQFLGNKDWNGFSCGVFFIRVSEWTVHMLNDVAALPRLRTDIQIYNSGRDQNAMKHVFRWEGREDDIVYQPRGWYNGFHNDAHNKTEVVEGDLLVHFAGTYKNRTGAMKEWMSKLQRESEKLAVPFEKTILKQDIEDFWADLKDAKTRLGELALELPKHNTTMTRSAYDELRKVVRYDPANSNRLDGAMRAARKAVEDIREKTTVREAKGKRPGVGAVR